ncbi:MAG: hypothetical protein ACXVB1_18975 [Pseudobdellovibrionaceae bacterium]
MGKLKITDAQREAFINAQVHIEVQFGNASPYEWPSLFSNLIEPYKKDLASARKFYESLSDEQIRMWEGGAWNRYEMLMGCSLSTLSKSIDPRIWSKKELLNVEMLLEQGKDQLMSSGHNFSVDEIPDIYNQLITGEWENFILIDDIDRFREAESKYWEDHGIDPSDITSLKSASLYISLNRPREKDFLNRAYIVAQEIQGLLWYKEFLKEVIRDGITFYNDQHEDLEQENKPKRKFVDIKNLQRTNDGYEAIKVSCSGSNLIGQ